MLSKENKTFRPFYINKQGKEDIQNIQQNFKQGKCDIQNILQKRISKENKTVRTFYKISSQACRGDPLAGEENVVECSECPFFLA